MAADPARKRLLLWIVGGVVALQALVVIWVALPASTQPFVDYVAESHSRGLPTTFAEFAGAMPPPDQNGGPALLAAHRRLVAEHGEPATWTQQGSWNPRCTAQWHVSASRDQLDATADLLDELRPYLAEVAEAAARPSIRFDVDASADQMAPGPHVSAFIDTGRILGTFALAARDPDERLRAMEAELRLSGADRRTVLIDLMTAMAMERASIWGVRHNLETGTIRAETVKQHLGPLLSAVPIPTIAEAASAIRIQCMSGFESVTHGGPSPGEPWIFDPTQHVFQKRISSLVEGTVYIGGGDDVAQTLRALERCSQPTASWKLARARTIAEAGSFQKRTLAFTVLNALDRFAFHNGMAEAATRLARVALAAAEHRATRGDYPASLADLAWAFPDGVPLDPYTDVAFVYARTATGVRLASAGRLTDDPAVDEAELREKCLVWELKR